MQCDCVMQPFLQSYTSLNHVLILSVAFVSEWFAGITLSITETQEAEQLPAYTASGHSQQQR